MNQLLPVASLLLSTSLPGGPVAAGEGEQPDWRQLFEADIAAVRDLIQSGHPGPVDRLNPDFGVWMDEGYRQQLALAESIDTPGEYEYALRRFVGGFRDNHLNIRIDLDGRAPRWPGFFATWRHGAVVVHSVSDSLASDLAEGDRLVSCDDLSADELLHRRVFDYQYNPDIPGLWVPAAARAFVDLGNPFADPPSSCRFERDGREFSVDLDWHEFSWDEHRADYDAARGRLQPEVGLFMPAEGVYWLQASTFGPNEEQVATYHDAFARLRESRDKANLVVFDLRGNSGGSSMWADLFAEALWDRSPGSNLEDESLYVEWRVSEGNIEHWRALLPMIRDQFGDSHPASQWAAHVLENLEAAAEAGKELWRETPFDTDPDPAEPAEEDESPGAAPYAGTVVLLTDTSCASACLDAMTLLSDMPGVVHVGSVTAADTQYMEARTETLPSGFATLVIPIKVYRGRVRPDGGYFTPSIEFDGLHWTDEAMRSWVLSLWREGELR